ncbi:MAG: tRNA dihydrouridine(20/20a) synthase DusA [Gammaproteobacteria bacterium WSBS_2016_MAG_OTU1]
MHPSARRFCTAPMMRYSHAPARRLWRFLCPPALIYTEMFACEAIIRARHQHLPMLQLGDNSPVALQLGGATPARLAMAAQIGEQYGAAEINLNCGCPSPRVRRGNFGASLMKTPDVVGACVAAIKQAVSIPVTVKCRIAVDDMDAETGLNIFARAAIANGADALIIHARRALLDGLNPAQNRTAPPLDYARARRLKYALGDFPIILNGGIDDIDAAKEHLTIFDGVMPGRAIVRRPLLLAEAAAQIYACPSPSPVDALRFMLEDIVSRPPNEWRRTIAALSGLFHGQPHSAQYRRCLSLPPDIAVQQLRGYC